jgi:hypothetical protein
MKDDDPFDLENFRLEPEFAATLAAAAGKREKARSKRSREQFVMVPWFWVERLKRARHTATYRVAHYVLYQHWKTGKPVPASNKALGMPRRTKWRAVRELERLGLVYVQSHPGRSPVIGVRTKT